MKRDITDKFPSSARTRIPQWFAAILLTVVTVGGGFFANRMVRTGDHLVEEVKHLSNRLSDIGIKVELNKNDILHLKGEK